MSPKFEAVAVCEQSRLIKTDIAVPEQPEDACIKSAKWKDETGAEDVKFGAVDKTRCVEVKTGGFLNDGSEITIEIKENKENAEVLKSIKLKINNNECITPTEGDTAIIIDKDWINKELIVNVTSEKTELFKGETIRIVCCENHIKKDDEGDFIEELNIRLCGFGGIQPERKVSKKTLDAIKQFQKDYMEVAETGYICKHILESIDEFMGKYTIPMEQLKCTCNSNNSSVLNHITGISETGSCSGFGNANDRKFETWLFRKAESPETEVIKTANGTPKTQIKETVFTIEQEYSVYVLAYDKSNNSKKNKEWLQANDNRQITTKKYIEKLKYTTNRGNDTSYCYEYPGMHRSLLWAYKAIVFYLEKEYGDTDTKFTINQISSGYRCRYKDTFQNAKSGLTFNHMGTAIDIHFNLNGSRTRETKYMEQIRKDICNKYIGAYLGWAPGKLGLELTSHGATTWVHIDCREFKNFKNQKFFKQTENEINGEKLIDIIETLDNGKFKTVIE